MNNSPEVSVTIPALNEEANLPALFESFCNQTNSDFEVVIVDNGSTDATRRIIEEEIALKRFALKLMSEEKKGVGNARRKGMNDAAQRGIAYLAGTDADGFVPPTWIADILATFEKTGADCLFGPGEWDLSKLGSRPDLQGVFREALTIRLALSRHIQSKPRGVNFAITRQMYEKIGGMPQPVGASGMPQPGEDIELSRLVTEHGGKVANIDSVVKTSPRRLMHALLNNTPNNYYADDTDMRNEDDLYRAVLAFDLEKARDFFDITIRRIFKDYIFNNVKKEIWEKAKQFVAPQEDQFVRDAESMSIDEIYTKYRELFISNAKGLQ